MHLPPFFDTTYNGRKYFEVIVTAALLISAAKFYIIVRIVTFLSPLNSSKGRFITALRGIDYTNSFLVKVWLTMNPMKGLMLGFIFFIFLNSYLLFTVERINDNIGIACYYNERYRSSSRVRSYKEAVWNTVITFMTVGYGDFFPTSSQGRYIMILTVIGGQLYSAIVIGLVHSQLALTSEESGVLSIITNNRKEKAKRVSAATLIYYLLKLAGVKNNLL